MIQEMGHKFLNKFVHQVNADILELIMTIGENIFGVGFDVSNVDQQRFQIKEE